MGLWDYGTMGLRDYGTTDYRTTDYRTIGLWDYGTMGLKRGWSPKAEGKRPWDWGPRELQISNLRFQKETKIMKVEVRRRPALRCGVGFKLVTDRRSGLVSSGRHWFRLLRLVTMLGLCLDPG